MPLWPGRVALVVNVLERSLPTGTTRRCPTCRSPARCRPLSSAIRSTVTRTSAPVGATSPAISHRVWPGRTSTVFVVPETSAPSVPAPPPPGRATAVTLTPNERNSTTRSATAAQPRRVSSTAASVGGRRLADWPHARTPAGRGRRAGVAGRCRRGAGGAGLKSTAAPSPAGPDRPVTAPWSTWADPLTRRTR